MHEKRLKTFGSYWRHDNVIGFQYAEVQFILSPKIRRKIEVADKENPIYIRSLVVVNLFGMFHTPNIQCLAQNEDSICIIQNLGNDWN